MKRILHIVGIMNLGGQETLIMNVMRKIDRNKYHFDFVVQSNEKGYYDDEIKRLGGNIYVIEPFSKSPFKHINQLHQILKKNKYNAIHRHTNSSIIFTDIIVAKFDKVKTIVVHCHSTKTNISSFFHKLFKPVLNMFSIKRVACSIDAGKFMFGKKKFSVINNGIDISRYLYNKSTRSRIRKELNIDNCFAIGHVGRFNDEKNHSFIIDVFKELKKCNSNIKLLLIGDGNNRKDIEKKVYENKLNNDVIFVGNVNNVYDYLQAMDLFIFPSLYEGLGISLIEAQASSLKCIVSDSIPNEAILSNDVKKISLDKDEIWISEISNYISSNYNRTIIKNESKVYTFDINQTVKDFEDLYEGELI